MRLPIRGETPYHRQTVGRCALGNHLAIYANPFAKRDEVRGYKKAGAIAFGATDGIDDGTNGAFAVRAGDVNDHAENSRRTAGNNTRAVCAAQTEFMQQPPSVFET